MVSYSVCSGSKPHAAIAEFGTNSDAEADSEVFTDEQVSSFTA
jgi:hypothetical protein